MHYDIVPARIEDCAVISELIHALAQFEKLADQCEATPEKIRLALFGAAPAAHCLLAWEVDEELQTRKPAAFALYFFNFLNNRFIKTICCNIVQIIPFICL